MLERLERETQAHHADAEADWLAILDDPSHEQYVRFLELLYGFEAPLEAAFALTRGLPMWIDVRARARSGLLAADLLALGHTAARLARLPLCCAIAPFDTIHEALGWIYVLDRSSLNLPYLHARLRERLPSQISNAGRYLASADAQSGHWAELGAVLDRIAVSPHASDRIVTAAHAAFERQHEWLGDLMERQSKAG
ncbi:MAG TPA: biliverdin-producing heme oxygenase [Kofleriaceae bacterium]|nr:biliverdin-producing heme oxygenase [Kofleriaceae bacterium]